MDGFAHDRLEAYRVAREFLARAHGICKELPRGSAWIADQLGRAAGGMLLTLAEGAGRRAGKEKAHLYEIALGSGTECAAALDVIEIRELALAGRVAEARRLLHRAVCMIAALVRSARRDESGA